VPYGQENGQVLIDVPAKVIDRTFFDSLTSSVLRLFYKCLKSGTYTYNVYDNILLLCTAYRFKYLLKENNNENLCPFYYISLHFDKKKGIFMLNLVH